MSTCGITNHYSGVCVKVGGTNTESILNYNKFLPNENIGNVQYVTKVRRNVELTLKA